MLSLFQTRADARALAIAITLGAGTGVLLGGAYLAGGMAKAADQHARVSRVAGKAAHGFSESALTQSAVDNGVLAVARRLDPLALPSPELSANDRQLAKLNEQLRTRLERQNGVLLRASLNGPYNPAAKPFTYPGALEGTRELDCLSQAVYYEARGETPSGQAAVAQVVINRARNPRFPQSICGVVFQRAASGKACQFSFACDGSTLRAREPRAWRRAQTIASRALGGYVMAEVGSATHFHTTNVAPAWGPRLLKVAQVGMHVFYRFGGRAGSPGAFNSDIQLAVNETTPGIDSLGAAVSDDVVLTSAAPIAASVLVQGGVGGPAAMSVEPASAPATVPAKPAAAPVKTTPTAAVKSEAKPAQVSSAT